MFKKNKRLIAFVLIFTISFTTYTMVQEKQVQAVVVVDDLIFWSLGFLILGTGAVAVSGSQIKDMGSRVWDSLSLEGIQENVLHRAIDGTIQGIKITSKLKEIINSVVSSLPEKDVSNEVVHSNFVSSFSIAKNSLPVLLEDTFNVESDTMKVATFSYDLSSVGNKQIMFYINNKAIVYETLYYKNFTKIVLCAYANKTNLGTTFNYYHMYGYDLNGVRNHIGMIDFVENIVVSVPDWAKVDFTTSTFTTIPYSNGSILENYNPTYTEENLKENNYIPLPNDLSIYDNVTPELPLTWDNVKDLVTDIPIDGTTDIPGDTTTDIPGDTTTDIPGDTTTDIPSDGALDLDVPKVATLDFSPLYISLKDKFPFCIPFDLYNMVSGFNAPKVAPNFTITFPKETMVGGGTFDFNFNNYSKIVLIFRYFILLTFLANLIKISRKLMGAE